jgi:putative SOS response-associated peptidase YedK
MCGRFLRTSSLEEVVSAFTAEGTMSLPVSFNVAPTTSIYVIRHDETRRVVEPMLWGLIPFWSKDTSRAANAINARAESLTEKPSFRHLVSRHRCILPLDGYYEWDTVSWRGKGHSKQPYLVSAIRGGGVDHAGLLGAAGLWSTWRDPDNDDSVVHSVAMVTTEATGRLAEIHHRMPLLVDVEELEEWLDPASDLPGWTSAPRGAMDVEVRAVSTRVNSVRNNDPTLIEPLASPEGEPTLF